MKTALFEHKMLSSVILLEFLTIYVIYLISTTVVIASL